MLHRIDYEKGIVKIEGKDYKLNDTYFPTIDKENPYKLSPREEEVMEILTRYFLNSEKLQRHLQFFLTNGSLYLKYNSNLLYHGCIPLNKKGELQEVVLRGVKVKGKDYLDGVEEIVRQAYYFQHQNVKIVLKWISYGICGVDKTHHYLGKMQ